MTRFKDMMHADPHAFARRLRPAAMAGAAILAFCLCLSAGAQQMPADSVFRDFVPTSDFVIEIGGELDEKAEVFQSRRAAAFLVMSSSLPEPVLLVPRSGQVQSVSVMKLARRPGGNVDILADAEFKPEGRFSPSGQEIKFTVGGKEAVFKPKPYLLGLHPADALLDYSVDYQRAADSYVPDATALAALKAQGKDVRVRVYFGSWCPACSRSVPPLLKVVEALEGSNVEFEFYGLPSPFGDEPEAKKDDVSSVPTGIVYVDGKEAGRLRGGPAWRIPELTIDDIVSGRYKG